MKLIDMCIGEIVSTTGEASLAEAATKMDEKCVGCLLVVNGRNQPVGILTDRDIVTKAVASDASMSRTRVEAVMSKDLVRANGEQSVAEAITLMGDRCVRRLIVVDESGQACGLLSIDDLVRVVSGELAGLGRIYQGQARPARRGPARDFTRMA